MKGQPGEMGSLAHLTRLEYFNLVNEFLMTLFEEDATEYDDQHKIDVHFLRKKMKDFINS
jgi:hypothetical protein